MKRPREVGTTQRRSRCPSLARRGQARGPRAQRAPAPPRGGRLRLAGRGARVCGRGQRGAPLRPVLPRPAPGRSGAMRRVSAQGPRGAAAAWAEEGGPSDLLGGGGGDKGWRGMGVSSRSRAGDPLLPGAARNRRGSRPRLCFPRSQWGHSHQPPPQVFRGAPARAAPPCPLGSLGRLGNLGRRRRGSPGAQPRVGPSLIPAGARRRGGLCVCVCAGSGSCSPSRLHICPRFWPCESVRGVNSSCSLCGPSRAPRADGDCAESGGGVWGPGPCAGGAFGGRGSPRAGVRGPCARPAPSSGQAEPQGGFRLGGTARARAGVGGWGVCAGPWGRGGARGRDGARGWLPGLRAAGSPTPLTDPHTCW